MIGRTGIRVHLSTPVPKKTTLELTTELRNEQNALLSQATLTAITLTLYDAVSGAIINSVSKVNVFGAGRGTWVEPGVLKLKLSPADNVLIDPAKDLESHVALVQWAYGATDEGWGEIEFDLKNNSKVV